MRRRCPAGGWPAVKLAAATGNRNGAHLRLHHRLHEADKIEPALKSVTWADEIVVADSFSTDRTVEIAAGIPIACCRCRSRARQAA